MLCGIIGAGSNFSAVSATRISTVPPQSAAHFPLVWCVHRAPSSCCGRCILQVGSLDNSFRRELEPVAPCKQPRLTRKARRSCRCVSQLVGDAILCAGACVYMNVDNTAHQRSPRRETLCKLTSKTRHKLRVGVDVFNWCDRLPVMVSRNVSCLQVN